MNSWHVSLLPHDLPDRYSTSCWWQSSSECYPNLQVKQVYNKFYSGAPHLKCNICLLSDKLDNK